MGAIGAVERGQGGECAVGRQLEHRAAPGAELVRKRAATLGCAVEIAITGQQQGRLRVGAIRAAKRHQLGECAVGGHLKNGAITVGAAI